MKTNRHRIRSAARWRTTRTPAAVTTAGEQRVSAAEFKARCLELMDRVRERGVQYVVTKHRRPVARLVPYEPASHSPFGILKATVLEYGDLISPIEAVWDVEDR